jgi:hypothetical protein
MRRILVLAVLAALAVPAAASARVVQFSGRTWYVRNSPQLSGPGPNRFSDAANSVWVDATGALHLTIHRVKGKWQSSEVFSDPLGRGTYTWSVDSGVNALDRNVVLGLFSYLDDSHEIDVEIARWGNAADPTNAQFVVQPYLHTGNLFRFTTPSGPTTYGFTWGASTVDFTGPSASWTYSGPDVPQPAGERVHMNLWLDRGNPPSDGRDVEVVLRSFSFTPAP